MSRPFTEPISSVSAEARNKAERDRLRKLAEDRKQITRETGISYHLWGLQLSCFRGIGPQSLHHTFQDGEWYDINILKVSARNGLNEFTFELKGDTYTFAYDEEQQGWRENIKLFSLFICDGSDRGLIEIPMKMRMDSEGRDYAILSDGPRAVIPDPLTNALINVGLKH